MQHGKTGDSGSLVIRFFKSLFLPGIKFEVADNQNFWNGSESTHLCYVISILLNPLCLQLSPFLHLTELRRLNTEIR